eukprot:403344308
MMNLLQQQQSLIQANLQMHSSLLSKPTTDQQHVNAAYRLDLEQFHSADPHTQTQMLTPDDYLNISLPDEVKVDWHQHKLIKRPPEEANGWGCDGKNQFVKCMSGITGFYQTATIQGWRCKPCDFDLCDKCVQVSLCIEKIKERED